jgi:hypothetical protein
MSRMPQLRKLPFVMAGLFAASSAFAAPLQTEVKDAQGQLLPNTMVWVVTPAGAEVAKTNTDAKGIAHFANIAPGHYKVEIRGSNGLQRQRKHRRRPQPSPPWQHLQPAPALQTMAPQRKRQRLRRLKSPPTACAANVPSCRPRSAPRSIPSTCA